MGKSDPGLHASPAGLGIVPVGVGEIGAVDPHDLHAEMHGIADRLGDGVGHVGLAEDIDAKRRYLVQGVVVGRGHNLRIGFGRDHGLATPAQQRNKAGLESLLLAEVVHPKHEIVMKDVCRHVDGPDLVIKIRGRLLR